ncbi:MAG: DUF5801 domain-containing protein, partial [Deltaproteobacteria bacterium]|nr:DUF5801 domain-containing protein [Deltaproteobacteria bacterium]
MAENTRLTRPGAGETSSVSVGPGARLEFAFNQADANLSKDGKDFVLTFDDGAVLRLQGFYNNFGDDARPPMLIVEGRELPGETFLATLNNPDLMPAAGPVAPPPLMGGGGWGGDALLNGVDGVGRLDKFGFDGWARNTASSPTSSSGGGNAPAAGVLFNDVPTISRTGAGLAPWIVDESLPVFGGAYTDGIKSATVAMAAQFSVNYGADGKGAPDVYNLTLAGVGGVPSGLFCVAPGGGKGAEILLSQAGNVITGSVGPDDYFTLTIDPATGAVTLELLSNIWHPNTTDPNDAVFLQLGAGALTLTLTVTDGSGDKASASIDLGASGVFQFRDDGPSVDLSGGIDTTGITLITRDAELSGGSADNLTGVSVATADLSSAVATAVAASVTSGNIKYGADGQGLPDDYAYSLSLSAPGVASGLAHGGESILLTVNGGVIEGHTATSGDLVFTVSVDTAGLVTLTQHLSIDHTRSDTAPNYETDIAWLAGNNVINLDVSVT